MQQRNKAKPNKIDRAGRDRNRQAAGGVGARSRHLNQSLLLNYIMAVVFAPLLARRRRRRAGGAAGVAQRSGRELNYLSAEFQDCFIIIVGLINNVSMFRVDTNRLNTFNYGCSLSLPLPIDLSPPPLALTLPALSSCLPLLRFALVNL